jgi:hypothetical protein
MRKEALSLPFPMQSAMLCLAPTLVYRLILRQAGHTAQNRLRAVAHAARPRDAILRTLRVCGGVRSNQGGGELGEIGQDQIGLMRCLAEWPLAPIDKRGPHAVRFGPDAVERVIGDKQDAGPILADDLRRPGISLPMRLEISGFGNRDHVIEAKSDMRPGSLEHIAVAV